MPVEAPPAGLQCALADGRPSRISLVPSLTDETHPTQILADLLTMEEFGEKPLN